MSDNLRVITLDNIRAEADTYAAILCDRLMDAAARACRVCKGQVGAELHMAATAKREELYDIASAGARINDCKAAARSEMRRELSNFISEVLK